MEAGTSVEKDCGALGNLFQAIINDMRGGAPVWEDFTYKATKLHSSLKLTLIAISAFLDAFQKIADMATSSRGATKEIGSALTRLCMRHRNIESKLKSFTNSILDSLVAPVQENLEDWKKVVAQLDKDHAKEYRRTRQEIKRAASDTVKLQKKVKKGKGEMQSRLEHAMHDVNDKYLLMEECEKNSVRTALIEERGRFCVFIGAIKPFVSSEIALLSEVTHLQETIDSLSCQAADPSILPTASEQVILDVKGVDYNIANFQKNSPPSSPSSLGSRKSSMCSINSITSSSSGSIKSHSPSHQNPHIKSMMQQPMAGTLRLNSISSQDSGFTSLDTLFLRPATPQSLNILQNFSEKDIPSSEVDPDSTPTTPSEHYPSTQSASSTWNNWPNQPSNSTKPDDFRPHTISTAYERSHHNRPALKAELFEPPPPGMLEKPRDQGAEMRPNMNGRNCRPHSASGTAPYARPSATINKMQPVLPPLGPKPKAKAVPPPMVPCLEEQPIYANTAEMAAANKATDGGDGSPESDTTATPPTPSNNGSSQPLTDSDMLNLQEAIKSLDSCTAALNDDYEPEPGVVGSQHKKMQKNSLELAEAIRELEASTAALESTYDEASYTSHTSLQCSSGYGTMNSTPSGSEDTIASGDFSLACTDHDQEKYYTIPRSRDLYAAYRAVIQPKRPASTAGIPVSQSGNVVSQRNSNGPKPPPPVRRTMSMSTGPPAALVKKLRASPPKQGPVIQHRRTHSASNSQNVEGPYAELQLIQESIHSQHQDANVAGHHPHQPQHQQLQQQQLLQQQQHHQLQQHHQQLQQQIQQQQQQLLQQHHQQQQLLLHQQPQLQQQQHVQQQNQPHLTNKQHLANQNFAHQQSTNRSSAVVPHHPVIPPTAVGGVTYAIPSVAGVVSGDGSPEHASVIQSLNAKFSQLSQQHAAAEDDVDFPLPPTDDELKEIEKLYSKPPPVHPKPSDSAVIMQMKRLASDPCSSDC